MSLVKPVMYLHVKAQSQVALSYMTYIIRLGLAYSSWTWPAFSPSAVGFDVGGTRTLGLENRYKVGLWITVNLLLSNLSLLILYY